MNVSVIVCTYNRCASLRRTLESFGAAVAPATLTWELLVIDNNSRDATRAVCDEFATRLPLRYVFEPRQGLSAARNCGLAAAHGELLAFTDDDVDVEPEWLANLWAAAQRHPAIAFFGGKISPRWDATPPRWLAEHAHSLLRHMTTTYDQGEMEKLAEPGECVFYGANMAFRRSAFANGLRFREDLGVKGTERTVGEETEMMNQLLRGGQRGLYVPAACVLHRNAVARMTEKYVRAYYTGAGISHVRLHPEENGRAVFGAPPVLWRKWLRHAGRYALSRWTQPSAVWLHAEIEMARSWGRITELRRRNGASA